MTHNITRGELMDYLKFIEMLPQQYENWGEDSVKPCSDKFQEVLDRVQGTTTANLMQLINLAVSCLEPGEIYCEIGTYQGSSLIGALLDQGDRHAYGVDNFSEWDESSESYETLIENLTQFKVLDRVEFYNEDFERFLLNLRDRQPTPKVGVYFYDCAYDYRSQLIGLLFMKNFLADRALVIVNNGHWKTVQQAQKDFIAAHPECQAIAELSTAVGEATFGNGIQVLSWTSSSKNPYSAASAQSRDRQPVG
ncbi:class I SAM-dependent methyltransferase [Laspinema sp. D1]|uniref:Class I SAM-dependent methyltransferase n=1 Tax=Laspinema palackyanum D2a TaxID=2953684 RepID=A0ABT2MWW5_9CYAN|nr:class I SAM-dependent methyltransferase [Laspinema sp. D2a]